MNENIVKIYGVYVGEKCVYVTLNREKAKELFVLLCDMDFEETVIIRIKNMECNRA